MSALRELLENDSSLIEHVKYQSTELCLMAVGVNGLNLKYVRFHTPAICETAVKQNGLALEFVQGYAKTLAVCIQAVRQNPEAVKFAMDANNDEMLTIIRAVPEVCRYLERLPT
jgi:hypothetical protein